MCHMKQYCCWHRRSFPLLLLTIGMMQSTGSISFAQAPPQIVSVTPADGAISVAPTNSIVFVFDQEMKVSVFPFPSLPPSLIGNVEFQPSTVHFTGTWGADKKTLTFKPSGALPFSTVVSWTLNPPGA